MTLEQCFQLPHITTFNGSRCIFELRTNYNSYLPAPRIFLQLCVPLFHFSVSWFSVMQFGVIYLKTRGSTQPYVVFSTLIFLLFLCYWRNTHGTEFSYAAWASVCWVLSQVSLVGSWMGFVFYVLRSEVKAPFRALVPGPSPTSV